MKIKVTNLSNGVHTFDFDGPISDLGLEAPFINNYELHVTIDKAHRQLLAICDLKLEADFECDRCNKEFKDTIDTSFTLVYFMSSSGDSEIPSEDDNVEIIPPYEDKIDLTEDVYEYAQLASPMKKVCSEECKGICPKCGKDLNKGSCNCSSDTIDDRWRPLLELKKRMKEN